MMCRSSDGSRSTGGVKVIAETASKACGIIDAAGNGEELGKALHDGERTVEYYTELQRKALATIARVVPAGQKNDVTESLKSLDKGLGDLRQAHDRPAQGCGGENVETVIDEN